MSFWKISIILTIAGSAYSGYQYYNNIEEAKTAIAELRPTIAQLQDSNQQHQQAWEKFEVIQAKAAQVYARQSELLKQKEELQNKIKGIESDFSSLIKSTQSTVDKVRADAAGQNHPEIKLSDGRVLRDAKIRKFEGVQVSFIHADGISTVPADLLPEPFRQRFAMGASDLVVEAATLEKSVFSSAGQQEFDGLTIRCPYTLLASGSPPGLPQNGIIKSNSVFSHKSPDMEVSVASLQYAEGAVLDPDGAIAGAVKGVTSLEGVSNPSRQVQHLGISGVPASRLSLTARRHGETLCLEAVCIARGQHLWFVQTVFSDKSKDARPTANSILSSIALNPLKP